MTIPEIVGDVVGRLEKVGIPYAVGGSLASSSWGQIRNTHDADIGILIELADLPKLQAAFPDPYYWAVHDLVYELSLTAEFRSMQVLHTEEGFKIDLFLMHGTEYDRSVFVRSRRLELVPGVVGNFYAPEDIVLTKLRWYVLGNRVSDRQWNDISQVLEAQMGRLDEPYLDKWADHFDVRDLLDLVRSRVR